MAKSNKPNSSDSQNLGAEQIPVMPIVVNAQYVKDLSFETPGPLAHAEAKEAPAINLNIEVKANPREADHQYEVEIHIVAEATRKEGRVFVLDLTYAGVFTLQNVAEQNIPPVLLIECPRLLFPFARAIVADVTRDGGFPPLALAPVDFAEIFRAQINQMQQQAAKK